MDRARDRPVDATAPEMSGREDVSTGPEAGDDFDIAAGRTVSMAEILASLDEAIARLRMQRRARRA